MKSLKDKKLIFEKKNIDTDEFFKEINWYKEEDVKERVLEFAQILRNQQGLSRLEDDELQEKFEEIFGDFEK